jgi:hypothetical protein
MLCMHVAVRKLLSERPAIASIMLPGMPTGSPGMTGKKTAPFISRFLQTDSRRSILYQRQTIELAVLFSEISKIGLHA